MSGYSGKPLWQKLGYTPGLKVLTIDAPPGYRELLDDVPQDIAIRKSATQPCRAVHLFVTSQSKLQSTLTELRHQIAQDGMLWVSWPKKASKMPTDVSENSIRDAALPLGFVDIKVCAVDDTWSGLKLVIRKEQRS